MRTRVAASLLLVPLLLGGAGLPARGAQPGIEPERPDQPSAGDDPREDAFARSAGKRVTAGPYTSVQVNVDSLGRNILHDAANEPSIAVNPTNPQNMVIGWRQFNNIVSNFRQAGWAYTFDGGASWTFPGVIEPGVFRSDPVLGADSSGAFHYQSLVGATFGVDVFTSLDGGVSWTRKTPSFGGDKNWMAIDRSGGPSDGHIYGIWQRFFSCCDPDTFTRSTDGGASFEAPVDVAYRPFFGTLAVGPDGEVYAGGGDGTFTQDVSVFVVARSTDARDPASAPSFTGRPVDLGGTMAFTAEPNPGGLIGQANVAVDGSAESSRGNVYLLASVAPYVALEGADPADVYVVRSRDGGATWSDPVRVNDDVSFANWQWFGALDVAPDGRIDAIWYDTRGSGRSNVSQLYYAYSYDEGDTWSANAAASPPFDSTVGWPNQNKIGDYITVLSDATGAVAAYPATFGGEQDVYFIRLFPDCNGNGISDVTDRSSDPSLDCDANRIPDACEAAPVCIGAGSVPDGAGTSGAPLRLGKEPGGDLRLTWGASCAAGDADYVVYEGTLGSFASHAAPTCGTGGATTTVRELPSGDAYFLIAPSNAGREGSLGRNSQGAERPQGTPACFPRAIRACAAKSP